MGNISDNLFQAIDILTAQKLGQLKYDKTLLCEIIDDTNKERGEYKVTDSSSVFIAYSDVTTYKNGMSVYVTIPEGDYSNRKIITGRYVEENGEYYTYVEPFNSYLDITKNYISNTKEDKHTEEHSLLANGPVNENVIWQWQRNEHEDRPIAKEYTRMGLSAKFRTWLSYLEPVTGSYGLRIDITSRETTKSNSSGTTNKHYSYYLDSSEFYGDIYNFETYYSQELVFDISMITEIEAIRIVFYQSNNFYDITKNKIATEDEGVLLPNNIFMKDLYLSFGFDANQFCEDTIFLYTLDGETYDVSTQKVKVGNEYKNLNTKKLQVRWVHFIDDKETHLVEVQDDFNPNEATIHWYHYKQQEGVCDDIAGHFWEEVPEALNKLELMIDPDITLQYEKYKVIIECPNGEWVKSEVASAIAKAGDVEQYGRYDENGNCIREGKLHEDLRNAESEIARLKALPQDQQKYYQSQLASQEQLKKVIEASLEGFKNTVIQIWTDYKAKKTYYYSETLTLQNETLVPNQATLDLVQGLQIIVDEVGLKGNYCIYGMTNELLNTREAYKTRILEAVYSSLVTGEPDLDKASTICWKIPSESTMIAAPVLGTDYVTRDYVNSLSEDEQKKYTELDYIETETVLDGQVVRLVNSNGDLIPFNGYYYLIRKGTEDYSKYDNDQSADATSQQISVKQTYKIKKYYQQSSTNNTVYCDVFKNNLTYCAHADMAFGPHGTNGTDTTLLLQLREYKNIDGTIVPGNLLSAVTPGMQNAMVEARLFDYNNQEIQIDNISWKRWASGALSALTISVDTTLSYKETIRTSDIDIDGNPVDQEKELTIYAVPVYARTINGNVDDDYVNFCHNIVEADVNCGNAEIGKQVGDGLDFTNIDGEGNPAHLKENVEQRAVTLSSYYSIPFVTNTTLAWAEVPTQVIYDSSGSNPTYYKDPFRVLTTGGEEFKITECKVIYDDKEENSPYYPTVRQNNGSFTLRPVGMYLNGLSKKVTLICKTPSGYWIQPLVILQNRWPSAMLNAWDGSLTIDEKNGTILATMIGAGKKEDDNSFTGVLMGDVETGAGMSRVNHTGVYGYHHGQQSFGLLDDGTAFFGKAGKGRIEFDGNSGIIKSMSYTMGQTGMMIDLDDGIIDIKGAKKVGENTDTKRFKYTTTNSQVLIQSLDPYLVIKTENAKEIMRIGSEKYYLQSEDFADKVGAKLDIAKGIFQAYDNNGSGNYVRISGNGHPFFQIRDAAKNIDIIYAGESRFYLQSSNFADKKGMKIDLNNGTLITYDDNGSGAFVKLSGTGSPFFQINDGSTNIFYATNGSYYMQSSGYNSTNGGVKINFSASDGGNSLEGGSGTTAWYIKKNGEATFTHITATSGGKIGPFTISDTALYTGAFKTANGVYLGTSGISVSDVFWVDASGNLTTEGDATIGGDVTVNGKLTITNEGYLRSGSNGKYYQFNTSGATIAGWIITEDTIKSKDGKIKLKSADDGAEIDIRGKDSSRHYFTMGTTTEHPTVSGLNITQPRTGGISFREVTGTQLGSISYENVYTAMTLGGGDWYCSGKMTFEKDVFSGGAFWVTMANGDDFGYGPGLGATISNGYNGTITFMSDFSIDILGTAHWNNYTYTVVNGIIQKPS